MRWDLFEWRKQGERPQSKQPADVCASHSHKTRVHVKGHNNAVILSPLAPKTTACSARGTHLATAHHTQTAGAWCRQNLAAGFFSPYPARAGPADSRMHANPVQTL